MLGHQGHQDTRTPQFSIDKAMLGDDVIMSLFKIEKIPENSAMSFMILTVYEKIP